MRNYECLFIVNPNFDGDGISTVIEKVTGYVKEADAEVANIQHWGKRRLAYQIEKQQYGNYVLMHLNGEAPKISDLQRSLELDDSVLAYLTVRLDEMPEFDKVMIPEEESEDDRRGGRSRYDDSRSRDGGSSYSRTRRSAEPEEAEEVEPADESELEDDVEIDAPVKAADPDLSESISTDDSDEAETEADVEAEADDKDDEDTAAEPAEEVADAPEADEAEEKEDRDGEEDVEEDEDKKEEA